MNKKYILAFGFRRLAACKKLGHKSVLALIHPNKEVEEISINEIDVKENTRLNDDTEGFDELMQSIKDNGLLQPIGVWKIDDLTEEDYITINLIENIHRKNISPYEMSQAIRGLLALGLNVGQIAVRLAQPKTRVQNLLSITSEGKMVEELKKSSFVDNKRNPKGKLPFAVLNQIVNSRIHKKFKKEIIDLAKEKELTLRQIRLLVELILSGKTIAQAKKDFEKLDILTVTIVYDKEKAKELMKKKGKKSLGNIVKDMLSGRTRLDTKPFK